MLNNSGSKPQAPLAPSNLATVYEKQAKVIMNEGENDNYQSAKSILMDAIGQKTNGLAKALIEAWPEKKRGYLDSIVADIYRSNNFKAYQLLRSKSINGPINEMMKLAVGKNDLDTISFLIKEGANVNGKMPHEYYILSCVSTGIITVSFERLDETSQTDSFLLIAVTHKKYATAALLIKHGANVNWSNDNGITPLLMAIMRQDHDSVKLLLENSANPNQLTEKKYWNTYDNLTPLEIALSLNNINTEIVTLLLIHGANPNPICRYSKAKNTLLIQAVANKETDLVKLLLAKQSNVNAQNLNGVTALMKAVKNGDAQTVELLVAHKPDLDIRANETAHKIGSKTIDVTENTRMLIQRESLFKPAKYKTLQTIVKRNVDDLVEEDQDIMGDSALEIAQKLNLHEIANFLKSKGATPSVKHTQALFLPSHIIPSAPPVSRQNSVAQSTGSVREGKERGSFGAGLF